jgi:hypothetical protein
MKRFNGAFRKWRKPLSAALLLTLTACGRESNFPTPPPQSPPRPVTFGGGHASIAVFYMAERPEPPPPGWM